MPKQQQICPVCDLPVGKDPHEDCFEQVKAQQEEAYQAGAGGRPVSMPCPACGQPMTDDHDCES